MKQLLINVSYSADGYWAESSLKNSLIAIDEDKDLHDQIAKILYEEDFCTLSYKNRPKGNIFVDVPYPKETKQEMTTKAVGYMYRGKHNIQKDNGWVNVNFDVWVEILGITEFKIEEIEL